MSCDHTPVDIDIQYNGSTVLLLARCDYCGAALSAEVGEDDWMIDPVDQAEREIEAAELAVNLARDAEADRCRS